MTTTQGAVTPQWLRLREPADAAARSRALARTLRGDLDPGARVVVHDLGCGSGSMGRWLAPLLPGAQHWVLHDRDPGLLRIAQTDPPRSSAAHPVTLETRTGDLAQLGRDDLAGAGLITASALLDMMTAAELEHLVRLCIEVGCPVLLTLSVTGRVRLSPSDPLDAVLEAAFNDHQRRTSEGREQLGPDAARAAADRLGGLGAEVEVAPSAWHLDDKSRSLLEAWLEGWVGAACEQRPELAPSGAAYLERRRADLEEGRLAVTVQHLDLLARPRGCG